MAVGDEEAWFDQNRPFIASSYPGQYVIIKNHAVQGAFPTYAAAVKTAIARFGPVGGFAIKQAVPEEPVHKIGMWAT